MSDTGSAGYGRAMSESFRKSWVKPLERFGVFILILFFWIWIMVQEEGRDRDETSLLGKILFFGAACVSLVFFAAVLITIIGGARLLVDAGMPVTAMVPPTPVIVISGLYLVIGAVFAFVEWRFSLADEREEDVYN